MTPALVLMFDPSRYRKMEEEQFYYLSVDFWSWELSDANLDPIKPKTLLAVIVPVIAARIQRGRLA